MPQKRKYQNDGARQAAYRRRQAQARLQERAEPRLPSLPAISSIPARVRWNAGIRRCADLLALIRDETASYYDDRSDAWQEGDRGEAHAEQVEALTEVVESLGLISF
jgi:hypothetical protein